MKKLLIIAIMAFSCSEQEEPKPTCPEGSVLREDGLCSYKAKEAVPSRWERKFEELKQNH